MIKSLKYTSFAAMSLAMLAACTSDDVENMGAAISDGSEKTPLEVIALLDAGTASQTRAADKDFAAGDQIVAYLRHVIWEGPVTSGNTENSRTPVSANKAPRLVTFTTGVSESYPGGEITPIGTGVALGLTTSNTKQTASLTPDETLYWDDFSVSSADGATDLRTAKHYLQSYYGYCYNGGTPSKALGSDAVQYKTEDGKIEWTIQTNQNTTGNFQKSDLLWSAEQTPEPYAHATFDGGIAHGKIVLPFTHAMSKVTINLTADKGFADSFKFTNTSIILEDVNTVCNAIAPTATLSSPGTPADVTMQQVKATEAKKATYSAIIVPTTLTKDNIFATINDADGNNYAINVTEAMLATATATTGGWGGQLTSGMTKSGVHYVLNVKLSKQEISVIATILDWNSVTAETTGLIQFSADVTDSGVSNSVTNTSFDLWMSRTNTDATTIEGRPGAATYDANAAEEGIQKASTFTYNSIKGKWFGSPSLYWPSGDQKYYFRALATYSEVGDEKTQTLTSVNGSQVATQGTDLLWAQTSAHTGTTDNGTVDYLAGAAIRPRTGDVPLTFQHAMSKISVTLKNKYTSTDVPTGVTATNYDDPRNPLVNLEGAKISIINLYDQGTIDISTGKMVTSSLVNSSTDPYTFSSEDDANKVNGEYKWLDKIVVPQSLEKDKVGANRDTNPSFYSLANLTAIYSNGKSIPVADETPTYYLTTALEKVEVKYTAEEANAYNLALPAPAAVWTTSTIKEPARLYTYDEYKTVFPTNEYQTLLESSFATIPTKAKQVDYTFDEFKDLPFSAELFAAIPNDLKIKTPAGTYADVNAYNTAKGLDGTDGKTPLTEEQFAALTEAEKAYPAVLFQDTEINDFETALASKETVFNSLSGDWKKKTLSLDEYKVLNPLPEDLFNLLPESLKTKPAVTYTEQEVNAHNATLPGAVKAGDIKTIYHKIKENTTPESHKIGELINRGNKIMLYVTLADGTIYSIDLATCKVDGSDVGITEWEGGIHYNYTITLSKEEITFRALVKDWVPAKGSGNATLDWD